MLIMDMPDIPPQQAPIIMLAQAAQPSTKELYGTVGVCSVSPKAEQMDAEKIKEGYYSLSTRAYADNIFSIKPLDHGIVDYENAEVTVLQQPKYGTLSKDLSPGKDISYYPDPGYIGNDKVIFLVNIEGYKIKVVYLIKVVDIKDFNANPSHRGECPKFTNWWVISSSKGDTNSLTSELDQSWFNLAQSNITLTFANLTGQAVGQTSDVNILGLQVASNEPANPANFAAEKVSKRYDYVLSACDRPDFHPSVSGSVYPAERVRQYFAITLKQPEFQLPSNTTLAVLQGFKHGNMVPLDEKSYGSLAFRYVPRNLDDFLNRQGGIDQAVLEIETMGKHIKLLYRILGDYAFSTEDPAEEHVRDIKCPPQVRRVSMFNGAGTYVAASDVQQQPKGSPISRPASSE